MLYLLLTADVQHLSICHIISRHKTYIKIKNYLHKNYKENTKQFLNKPALTLTYNLSWYCTFTWGQRVEQVCGVVEPVICFIVFLWRNRKTPNLTPRLGLIQVINIKLSSSRAFAYCKIKRKKNQIHYRPLLKSTSLGSNLQFTFFSNMYRARDGWDIRSWYNLMDILIRE